MGFFPFLAPFSLACAQSHWAYQPLARATPPHAQSSSWPRGQIDQFILAGMEQQGLAPAPDASGLDLVRRVYYDLTGLPPTPQQIRDFMADQSPDAYLRLVDRLLASPRFGERWGRHWLDIVRFGESVTLRGLVFPNAWRYRDYVIAAFNQDLPLDQFIREQIAGDLLPAPTLADQQRQLVATTFLALGNSNLENQDKPQLEMDVIDEQLDVISKAFLAQTVTCARCHDHKFDPIPTRDYYALAGILKSANTLVHANVSGWVEVPFPLPSDQEASLKRHEEAVANLQPQIAQAKHLLAQLKDRESTQPETAPSANTAQKQKLLADIKHLETQLETLKKSSPLRPMVMSVEEKNPGDIPIRIRGSVHAKGEIAPRGFLQAARGKNPPRIPDHESGRRQLADWITDPDNPLTARVQVNRIWHWLFGQGLVRTPDNFGTTGIAPTHPELLDHLARQFIQQDWSVKTLIRLLVTSRVYQLSTAPDSQAAIADPENKWLTHMNRRRLQAEALRDTLLAIGGQLDLAMGGSTMPRGLKSDYSSQYTGRRRSVYVPVFRNSLPEIFEVFDFADPSRVVGSRGASTVAPQALYLMNHPFVQEQARQAAARILAEPSASSTGQRLQHAFQLILGRPPFPAETRLSLQFLQAAEPSADQASASLETWAQLAQTLFATIDFRYLN